MTAPATASAPLAVSHIAVNTADLDRYRAFYEGVLGFRTAVVLRMGWPPYLRHAFVFVEDTTVLHVFEQPGYDPVADGIPTEMGRRGRIDHFGFLVRDVATLEAIRDRLVAAGASDGAVTPLGPMLSVHFRDPDGLEGEINAVDEAFELAVMEGEEVLEVVDPDWFDRVRNSVGIVGAA